MDFPAYLKYAKSHEWVKDIGNGLYEIGISDYAQKELGDIVYVNLPQLGDELKTGEAFADLESVKAVSDLVSPMDGIVIEVNDDVISRPDVINKTPYEAWFVRIEGSLADSLLSAEEYEALL